MITNSNLEQSFSVKYVVLITLYTLILIFSLSIDSTKPTGPFEGELSQRFQVLEAAAVVDADLSLII